MSRPAVKSQVARLMTTRPPVFELHIVPLMRLLDREQMIKKKGIDLWNFEQVRKNSAKILTRIRSDMPPVSYGGLWPVEWITLFELWVNGGFQRLQLGKVDAKGYKAVRSGSVVTITAKGTVPGDGYQTWLQPVMTENAPRSYILYLQPPFPATPESPTGFRVREDFNAPLTMESISIVDVDGSHLTAIS